jgi:hypothetical protein
MQVTQFVGGPIVGKTAVLPGDPVRIVLIGSRDSVNRTIRRFHALHFADPNDWSPLQPLQETHEVITMLIKRI